MLPLSRNSTALDFIPVLSIRAGLAGCREVPRTTGTREKEVEAAQSLLNLSLGDSEGSGFLSFLLHLGHTVYLSGDTMGISRYELEQFQRWNIFRNKKWYFWRQDKDVPRDKMKNMYGRGALLKVKLVFFGVKMRPFLILNIVRDETFLEMDNF